MHRARLVWLCNTGSHFVVVWLCWDCWLSSLLVPPVSAGPSGFFSACCLGSKWWSCCEWMDLVKSFSILSPPHFVNLFPSWLTHCIRAAAMYSPCIRVCGWLPSATACNKIFWFQTSLGSRADSYQYTLTDVMISYLWHPCVCNLGWGVQKQDLTRWNCYSRSSLIHVVVSDESTLLWITSPWQW